MIARHRAVDHFRRVRETAPLDSVEPATPRGAAPDAFLVLEGIRSLPEAYREPLILRLVEGMTGPEIAAQTGLTPASVRVNLCRGMKMLRELLEAK
jgi:RNA polymerase sigma-70 factor (ECF subfamily)